MNPHLTFKLLFMLLEVLAMESDNASIVGLTYIIDCRDVDANFLMRFQPMLIQKVCNFMECCMPLKLNEIHIINMRQDSLPLFNYDTAFMSKQIYFKFLIHKKAEHLFEYLPRDAMTVEYGGHNGYISEAIQSFKQKLLNQREYFIQNSRNEKSRICQEKKLELNDMNGVMGYFRKLELD